jgi:hypothetical protein
MARRLTKLNPMTTTPFHTLTIDLSALTPKELRLLNVGFLAAMVGSMDDDELTYELSSAQSQISAFKELSEK